MSDNRDWQADMDEINRLNGGVDILGDGTLMVPTIAIGNFAREALPYWLQQYAAEKERADKLEELLSKDVAKLRAEVSKETEHDAIYNIMNFRLCMAEAREKRLIEFIIKVMNTPDVDKEDLGIEARVFLQKLYGGVPVMDKEAEA